MKRGLRCLALVVLAAALVYWLATGMNRGWTRTSVPIQTPDPVTGLEGITWENRFVPGVDFLGAATLGAGVLAGVSFLFRTKNPSHP